jgi:2-oxoglutarate dehydrogenase E2 component (dihydrolipoamide succinyltransferase)
MSVLVDITVPQEAEGVESVLERWLRKHGDTIQLHEPLLEINTDKATIEVPAPATGILREILKQPNEPIGPSDVLGRIEVARENKARATEPSRSSAQTKSVIASTTREAELSPAVRQLVKKHHLDVALIPGTGRRGRITHEDVQNYLKLATSGSNEAAPSGRRIPHSAIRRRTAQHMVESLLQTAPHVTAVFDADLCAVVNHRNLHREEYKRQGVSLTYTAYFVAAAVQALQAVPEVNSRWHADALEVFGDSNIGVATAAPSGLLVPVIHRAQTLDLIGIARRLQDLTAKARASKLEPAELRNGTFTITNHGVSGSLIATPIIHQPQSAILGIGKIEKRLVVVEEKGRDSIQVKPMAYVTLTIDHRALDGFQANAFLSRLVDALRQF